MIDRQTEDTSQFETHKCPVCNGFRTLKYGTIKCESCDGRGYIIIDRMTGLPIKDRQKDEKKEEGVD